MLSEIKCLDDYTTKYASLLGQKAVTATLPLFVAGKSPDPVDLSFVSVNPPHVVPYACQKNVIFGVVLAWLRQRAMIICGEMGTGKTLLAAAAIHAHATKTGRVGYRALIMCPNHLIDKWEREIYRYVPGAIVHKFEKSDPNKADDSYKEVARYIRSCKAGPGKWKPATRPEFAIVGRNQAKQEAGTLGLGEMEHPHGTEPGVAYTRVVDEEVVVGEDGRPVMVDGKPLMRPVKARVPVCPKCGQPARKGKYRTSFATLWEEQITCGSKYLREIVTPGSKRQGVDVICPIPPEFEKFKAGDPARHESGSTVWHEKRQYEVMACGEPLWQYAPKPRKWAPAKLFHKQGRKMFDYFVLDEMHECKGDGGTAQANAAGKLMATAKRILGLTGTLIGGYADHLYPLLFRMAPETVVSEEFKWGEKMPFVNLYGVIETTITIKVGGETRQKKTRKRGTVSMRAEYEGDMDERKEIKPGVMPSFFGRHMIDKAVFISLDELYDDLPMLIDDDRSLIPVDMDPPLDNEFHRIRAELIQENDRLVQLGSTKLLSAMLHTLLEYPDKPYGWDGPYEDEMAVGYHKGEGRSLKQWVGVVQPADLDDNVIYAKEQALFDLCYREVCEGRQVWVYCTQTGKRDVQARLAGILNRGGLKTKVMRSSQVETYDREQWIFDHGPHHHVIISHPELVSTGLDFFDKDSTFNFCTIVFYEGDYRVNLIRQSGRRHWRIGQQKECRTFYLYYRGTMQERQIKHVGDKYAAAKSLEGKFSAEGLAAMSQGGTPMLQMARALTEKIDDPRKAWSKLRDEQKAKLVKMHRNGSLATLAAAVKAEPELSVVGMSIIEDDEEIEIVDLDDDEEIEIVDIDDDDLDTIMAQVIKIAG